MGLNSPCKISTYCGGYDKNISYLISFQDSMKAVLIDASLPIHNLKFEKDISLLCIFVTHTHGDHIAYLNEYIDRFPDLVIYTADRTFLRKIISSEVHFVDDKSVIQFEGVDFTVLHTPGHYPDSICIKLGHVIFTGDTLFVGRTGRLVGSQSNIVDLYHSIYSKLLLLSKDILIYPGHDYGPKINIELGENIQISPLLQAQNIDHFVELMAEYEKNRKN